ncbi:insulinase family protein [Rossellomorea vietnamensis]|uniref:Insulinase family protein n=1 Tax=Rossellomorea vietnamensis TaxID=218284 RepID=A0A5D4NRF7_9BACI|nr:pitrilysin family protein [Rossellomorea vietnamensis]TYS16224.1 insulinase family protein [Rossellomorea vietnamensis]
MSIVNEVVKTKSGYSLHIVRTDKYKTNTLVWRMKSPLKAEEVTPRGLLPHVLQSSAKKYPSTTALRSYLDELYGANFFVDLAKKGEYHVMSFSVEVANEKFLKDSEPLLRKGLQFLADVVLYPNISGDSFHTETVEKEKKNQKVRIQSVFDDKMRYANSRLVEEMCKDEPYSLHPNGILEEVDKTSAESLYKYYREAIQNDEMDLYVIGDVDAEEAEKMCEEIFSLQNRDAQVISSANSGSFHEVNEVVEKHDVKQGKLNIGYRTNVAYGADDYWALQVFNGVFGGFSHSKLFINVREKASLAYYAASRLESHKGLMMVMSGIDGKNYDQAVTIIKEQMQAMKNGDFTEGEIQQTKAVIRNQLLETIDTPRGLVEILYHNVVSGQKIELDHWLESIEKVTKEEITTVAKKVNMDTIYFLTGMEG